MVGGRGVNHSDSNMEGVNMRNPNYSANTGDSQSWEFRGMTDQFSHFICKETELQEGKVTFSRHTAKKSHHLHSRLTSGSMLFLPKKKKKIKTAQVQQMYWASKINNFSN